MDNPLSYGFSCQNIRFIYTGKNHRVVALDNVSFHVHPHEFVCLVGPSGCGKTTLLKVMTGLLKPSSGTLSFGNSNSQHSKSSALVFQEQGAFPWMTVQDNVAFGLEMNGLPKKQAREKARALIERVGLSSFLNSYPHTLSVGMRQRIGIARALAIDPIMLLMDEPFGALDAQTKLLLQEELLKIWKDNRYSIIYVTHDIEEAILLGDRLLVMSGRPGHILEDICIPLDRPRDLLGWDHPELQNIKWHVWKLIEAEVRNSLGLPC